MYGNDQKKFDSVCVCVCVCDNFTATVYEVYHFSLIFRLLRSNTEYVLYGKN